MTSFTLFFSSVLLSWFLTGRIKLYAIKKELIVFPDKRSSHIFPTPTGGGLSIVFCFLVCNLYLFISGELSKEIFYAFLPGSFMVATIGFLDDNDHIPAFWRLLIHISSATLFWCMIDSPLNFFFCNLNLCPLWLVCLFGIFFMVWLLNLFNFMDGTDGLAAIETIFIAGSYALFVLTAYNPSDVQNQINDTNFKVIFWFSIITAGSSTGFLFWNWPAAKIFMGDVGSGFLGFILGALGIFMASLKVITLWTVLILFGVFFVDATVTLIRRIAGGEKWYEAHRTHAYQKYVSNLSQRVNRTYAHRKLLFIVTFTNIFWLFPWAWLSQEYQQWGALFTFMALFPLIKIVWSRGAGKS